MREKAVQSLRLLAREHTDKDLQEQVFPLVRRLAAGDWFSSRASACGLFAVVYGRLDASSRQEILSLAQSLTKWVPNSCSVLSITSDYNYPLSLL